MPAMPVVCAACNEAGAHRRCSPGRGHPHRPAPGHPPPRAIAGSPLHPVVTPTATKLPASLPRVKGLPAPAPGKVVPARSRAPRPVGSAGSEAIDGLHLMAVEASG
jgi:hypothetical protein